MTVMDNLRWEFFCRACDRYGKSKMRNYCSTYHMTVVDNLK